MEAAARLFQLLALMLSCALGLVLQQRVMMQRAGARLMAQSAERRNERTMKETDGDVSRSLHETGSMSTQWRW